MPVDVPAGLAPGELVLRAQRPLLKLVCHLSLRNRREDSSAGQAEAPRRQGWPEPFDDVGQLVVGVLTAHKGSTAQGPTHQKAPVSAEQHPILTSGLLDEMVIVSVLVVCRLDAQEPKPAGQRAEVHIQQEERRAVHWLGAGPDNDVEPVLLLQPTSPRNQPPVQEQVSDLGQGHAGTLDEMACCGVWVVRHVELTALAASSR